MFNLFKSSNKKSPVSAKKETPTIKSIITSLGGVFKNDNDFVYKGVDMSLRGDRISILSTPHKFFKSWHDWPRDAVAHSGSGVRWVEKEYVMKALTRCQITDRLLKDESWMRQRRINDLKKYLPYKFKIIDHRHPYRENEELLEVQHGEYSLSIRINSDGTIDHKITHRGYEMKVRPERWMELIKNI